MYSQVTADGLIAAYCFSGNTNDVSGNFHSAINVIGAQATLSNDRFGNSNSAYLFDGSSSHMIVAHATELNLSSTDYTISAWINPNGYGNSSDVLILSKRDNNKGFKLGLDGNVNSHTGVPGAVEFQASGGNDPYVATTFAIAQNVWTQIVIKYVLATQTIYIYTGVENAPILAVSTASNFPTLSSTESSDLYIGMDTNGNNPYQFPGFIDDIYIYNRALSDTEISNLHSINSSCLLISGINHLDENAPSIYPNPVANFITVSGIMPKTPIVITNPLGEVLISEATTSEKKEIDISSLPAGIYFINNRRFVKQ